MDISLIRSILQDKVEGYLQLKRALSSIGDRWSGLILLCLLDESQRFSDIQRHLPGINSRTLTHRLRMLELDGLVTRQERNESPPRVTYALTTKARELEATLDELRKWAAKYCKTPRLPRTSKTRPAWLSLWHLQSILLIRSHV